MRLISFFATGFAFLTIGGNAIAQNEWPTQPIEFVCATSPGSGGANGCLLMSELVGEELGVPIEILFKPAGAGNEAGSYYAEKPADGYTWAQSSTSFAGYMNLPTFKPDHDLFKVALEVEKFIYVIAVNADSPYESWEDLVTAMKDADEPIAVAANKPGSAHHLHLVRLFEAAGVPFTYVPYNGAGGAMRDVLGGHVDVAIGPSGIWLPHVESGDARFLLLINEERVDREGLTDLPIPSEFGIDYDIIHQVQGVFTKPDTDPAINKKIYEAYLAATKTDRYKEYLAQNPHVVPILSGDVEANNERFTEMLEVMKKALEDAGLI